MTRRGKGVRWVLLCEDSNHIRFARYVFLKLGYSYHELRVQQSPPGKGAAEQWVRKQYANEVRVHRRKASSQQVGLAVVIDADRHTVKERHAQLSKELTNAELPDRGSNERIVLWVPRRHIETWVAYLLEHDVNEEDDCKSLVRDVDYRPPTDRFVSLSHDRDEKPVELLPSISVAFDELDRLS
ncbi:MAG: hypothetical protein KAY37_04115 [Phycisphaerae bacterium]|nr:hypothetical protein [Phycisphaerae bacterium]